MQADEGRTSGGEDRAGEGESQGDWRERQGGEARQEETEGHLLQGRQAETWGGISEGEEGDEDKESWKESGREGQEEDKGGGGKGRVGGRRAGAAAPGTGGLTLTTGQLQCAVSPGEVHLCNFHRDECCTVVSPQHKRHRSHLDLKGSLK